MKFSSLVAAIPIFGMVTSHMVDYDAQLQDVLNTPYLDKRATNNSLTPLIQTLAGSGLITSLLQKVTSSQENMDKVADLVLTAVTSVEDSIFANVSVNFTGSELLHGAMGLVPSIADGLLLNETNRNLVAVIGSILLSNKEYTWIPTLILKLGKGSELSVPVLADLMINGTEHLKMSGYGKIEKVNVVKDKRATSDDGSFELFINNVIGTLLKSDLLKASADELFDAIEQSGVLVPLILDVLTIRTLPNLIATVLRKLYDNHVFDNLDLNPHFVALKKSGAMADMTQDLFTDKKYSPGIGALLKKIEDLGTFKAITKNMYGDAANV